MIEGRREHGDHVPPCLPVVLGLSPSPLSHRRRDQHVGRDLAHAIGPEHTDDRAQGIGACDAAEGRHDCARRARVRVIEHGDELPRGPVVAQLSEGRHRCESGGFGVVRDTTEQDRQRPRVAQVSERGEHRGAHVRVLIPGPTHQGHDRARIADAIEGLGGGDAHLGCGVAEPADHGDDHLGRPDGGEGVDRGVAHVHVGVAEGAHEGGHGALVTDASEGTGGARPHVGVRIVEPVEQVRHRLPQPHPSGRLGGLGPYARVPIADRLEQRPAHLVGRIGPEQAHHLAPPRRVPGLEVVVQPRQAALPLEAEAWQDEQHQRGDRERTAHGRVIVHPARRHHVGACGRRATAEGRSWPVARRAARVRAAMKRYLVQTFGCQMNVHDSRRIEEVLRGAGYTPTDEPTLADLLLVNTCSVREKAEHKLMSLLGRLRPLKDARRGTLLAVAGCVAQQEGERLLHKAPFVDLVLGPDNIPELPALLREVAGGAPPMARTVFDLTDPRFLVARPHADRPEVTAYVTVMKGCDERCTYCIVPYTRGPERYRPASDIVEEIARLVEGGVREVTLVGQTVNSWHEPGEGAGDASEFARLLRRIAREVPALARLRYTSPHPRHVTAELVAAHRELDVLPAHVHLPVQSGSDRVLRRMLRRYTRAHYVERARALTGARPGLTLSTDLIVGFPGETEEDFAETLSLVSEVGFVAAFAFKYSPRPYTPALKLGDDVPDEVKDTRLAQLFAQVEVQQSAHLASLVGTRQQVLVEGPDRDGGRFTGRSGRHEIVHVEPPAGVDPTGRLVDVDIALANRHSLVGVMDGATLGTEPRARRRRALPLVPAGDEVA